MLTSPARALSARQGPRYRPESTSLEQSVTHKPAGHATGVSAVAGLMPGAETVQNVQDANVSRPSSPTGLDNRTRRAKSRDAASDGPPRREVSSQAVDRACRPSQNLGKVWLHLGVRWPERRLEGAIRVFRRAARPQRCGSRRLRLIGMLLGWHTACSAAWEDLPWSSL